MASRPVAVLAAALACACHPLPDGEQPDAGRQADAGHPTPGPGIAAAWQVSDPKDLVPGPSTHGQAGDWVMVNTRVRFVIEGAHPSDGYDPYGCSIVAADRQRSPDEPGESRFGEIWMGLDFRAPGCDQVQLVDDGRGGEPAHLRAVGRDE